MYERMVDFKTLKNWNGTVRMKYGLVRMMTICMNVMGCGESDGCHVSSHLAGP